MAEDHRRPVIGDAFGTILKRCMDVGVAAGVAHEIVERDDGYLGVGDAVRYFAADDEWSPVDRWACDRATGRVLDVGCGAGRHALPLARKGHDVVGLDASPGAVDVATRRGVTAVLGTVEQLPPALGSFDTVLLLGNNLGLLAGPGHARTVLANLAAATRPGGRLLGTGLDPHHTNDEAHLAYHDRNRQRGRLPGQARLRIRDGAVATEWFDYLFVPLAELRELLAETPWHLRQAFEHEAGYAVHLDHRP
ncbi:MAG: methyltransferase domain-containing protein [Actinophytocola sp.]|uniref:class I SAM-dependent methyltransferase n=1 Tax=Actinophytocola sp. TaxID=1872138 RepID=UPI001328A04E|nr:class I SAM-dependent methyltransferase [Actinophytocola sp.]MPZ82397.1 methyltransferase domain-containing protein [Actinophytocola sp.]